MQNNLTLQVMRSLAARQGYHPQENPVSAQEPVGPCRLDRTEEDMLLRAIRGQEAGSAARQNLPKATGERVSLDELAAQRR